MTLVGSPTVTKRTLTTRVALVDAEPLVQPSAFVPDRQGGYRYEPVELLVTWEWLDDPVERHLRTVHVRGWPLDRSDKRFTLSDEPNHYTIYPSDLRAAPTWLRDAVMLSGELCLNAVTPEGEPGE